MSCHDYIAFELPSIARPFKPSVRQKQNRCWAVVCNRCKCIHDATEVAMRDGSSYLVLPKGWRCIVNSKAPHSEDDPFFCAECFTVVCLVESGPEAQHRIFEIQSIYRQSRRKLIRKPRAIRKSRSEQLDLFTNHHE